MEAHLSAEPLDRLVLLAAARRWIGTPYRHQASLKGAGCDCLGLIRGLWREYLGDEPEPLTPYAPDWAEAAEGPEAETLLAAAERWLVPVSLHKRQPGDVLLFRWRDGAPVKHAGILSTGEQLIHAYERVGVIECPLGTAWARRITHVFSFPGALPWQP